MAPLTSIVAPLRCRARPVARNAISSATSSGRDHLAHRERSVDARRCRRARSPRSPTSACARCPARRRRRGCRRSRSCARSSASRSARAAFEAAYADRVAIAEPRCGSPARERDDRAAAGCEEVADAPRASGSTGSSTFTLQRRLPVLVPELVAAVERRLAQDRRRVDDDDVDAPAPRDRLGEERARGAGQRQVGLDEQAVAPREAPRRPPRRPRGCEP